MIIKPLKPTHELLQIESLNRRLSHHHLKKRIISTKARNLRAGYNGERALQFPLSFLSKEKYHIFHHLLFRDLQGKFQIDALLLSTNFLLIIEVKNIKDNMTFDKLGQAYRKEVDRDQGFNNPVQQVKLQHARFLQMLQKFNFPTIPIEKIVVYTNPSTVLTDQTGQDELRKIVMHKELLLEKVAEFEEAHPIRSFSDEQLVALGKKLIDLHRDEEIDVLQKYEINRSDLINGVICAECAAAPMLRVAGKWSCQQCNHVSFTAHEEALRDYALLISRFIKNREARKLLQLESSNVAKQLLQKMGSEATGVTSARRYRLEIEGV